MYELTKEKKDAKMLASTNKKEVSMNLTNSQEEYLKTIYILSKTEKEIRVTDIAKKLKITKPSVNRAMKNLKDMQLLNYESYGKINLAKEGEMLAKEILKREDILKIFLTKILDINEEQAKKEAIAMKHAISQETEKRLEKFINKVLNLGDLECDYDENSEKCKNCIKITAKNRLNKDKKK